MGFHVRFTLLALVTGVVVALSAAPSASAFGVEKLFAGNCKVETCGEGAEGPKTPAEAEATGFQQAGGWVPYGVTDFKLKTVGPLPEGIPGNPGAGVKALRTDVAPGVVTNPEAVPKCSLKSFEGTLAEPTHHFYTEPSCPTDTIVGVNRVLTAVEVAKGVFADVPLEGLVYNLDQPPGLASDYGVAVSVAALTKGAPLVSHSYIEGNVEWLSDYHDYFKINNIGEGLVESRLVFFGAAAKPTVNGKTYEINNIGFLRNPSACTVKGPDTRTSLSAESYEGESASSSYEDLVGTTECKTETFEPKFALEPETTGADQPDGVTVKVTMPHPTPKAGEQDQSDLSTAEATLPEGLTMNPSAAAGLEGCTPRQIGLSPAAPTVTCPSNSRIGTVQLEVPTLPPGSLRGDVYLGREEGKAIEGPPYKIFLDAESPENRYNVKVRLEGTVEAAPGTGRLTTRFVNNPRAPFNAAMLHFKGGVFGALANPDSCGSAAFRAAFTSYAAGLGPAYEEPAFTTVGCANFAPTQSTGVQPAQGGANTAFTLNMERPEGQPYLTSVSTTMPPGLAGAIPAATQCGEAEANAGACPASSQIGTVAAAAGSGEPYVFHGNVYLTGPYQGAPFGLSIVVPVVAGPFNFGNEVTRAKIQIKQDTAQVVVSANLPTINAKAHVPIRLRSLAVTINRQGFERNPTNCGVLYTETTFGANGVSSLAKTPFQAEGCSSLAFSPSFKGVTSGKTSRLNGAALETTINQPSGQANIKAVEVTLPKQLVSRQSTNEKACLPQVFASNPSSCPKESLVGSARANTPLLPTKMSGPAYLVARGGAQFPDLDLVLEGDGVRVILNGHTFIKNGRTTTLFEATPDVPVSSITVNLPAQRYSALAPNGNLCTQPLIMPTLITAQNGKTVKQSTKLTVKNCGVQIVGHKVVGRTAYLTVRTFSSGRVSATGSGVNGARRSFNSAQNAASLKVTSRRRGRVKIRVGFVPKGKGLSSSTAFVTVTFR